MKTNKALFFVILSLFFFFYPNSAFSEYPKATQLNFLLVSNIQIKPDQYIKSDVKPTICRLTLKKSVSDNFKLLKTEVMSGKISHFFKKEYSDYFIEVWQSGHIIFSGGFKNPNNIRFESLEDNHPQEQKESYLSEATFLLRVPIKNINEPINIKFYRMKANL